MTRTYGLFDPAPLQGEPLSVASYLELINVALGSQKAKITGEVSQVKVASSGHVYFSLKDQKENAVLDCVMWRGNYQMAGILLEVGMAVAVTGAPGIYAPTGRFSFKADTVELVGEGALKKEYDKLKKKLEIEGVFLPERKRPIPEYPERIGIITSKHGAVIHDFLNNLGRFGYSVIMVDSRVEGAQSVADLRAAFRTMRKQKIDLLVVIRGGGSLESLIGFNNEALIREIIDFPVPVCAGIGHDQDVPLFALAADTMSSTPTAVAHLVNKSWEQALTVLFKTERNIMTSFEADFREASLVATSFAAGLSDMLTRIAVYYQKVESAVRVSLAALGGHLAREKLAIRSRAVAIVGNFERLLVSVEARTVETGVRDIIPRMNNGLVATYTKLAHTEKMIAFNDPRRQLALGYAIAKRNDKVLRSVKDVQTGDHVELLLSDGALDTMIQS